jgi:hypothetical protein
MHRTHRGLMAIGAVTVLWLGLMSPTTATASPTAPARDHDLAESHDLVENTAREAFERAVAPTECASTPVDAYVGGLVTAMTAEQFAFVLSHQDMLSVPLYDSLFFGTEGDPDYALDLQARELQHTFRDLTRFWSDIRSDDIQVMAMHGAVLLDAERITATLSAMMQAGVIAPRTDAEIALEAQTVADFMAAQGDFHDNPLWTLNAYAFSGRGYLDPLLAAVPDKIVFGDGILAMYDALGLGDVGPRVIMSHEFAHHIQIELGTFETGPADRAEATRRTELMADAMATYHGVHKKGLTLNRKRAADALLSFSAIGDCLFDSPAHHGTPLQRERASAWGADLAAAARPRSHVLPAETVIAEFDAALPAIVAGS